MWHECTDCGKTFCDECGRSCLAGKNEDTDHTRVCPECGSATKLF
jgi:DNA-directed RNA polymerase subunit M/transcription elongation factor TFIIS